MGDKEWLSNNEIIKKGEKIWSPNRYWTLSIGPEGTLIASSATSPQGKNYLLTLWAIGDKTAEDIIVKLEDYAVISAYKSTNPGKPDNRTIRIWSKDDIMKSMPAKAGFLEKLKPPFSLGINDEGEVELYDNDKKRGNVIWTSKNSLAIDVKNSDGTLVQYDESKIDVVEMGTQESYSTICDNDRDVEATMRVQQTVELSETNSWTHSTTKSSSNKHTAKIGFKVKMGGKDSFFSGEVSGGYEYEHVKTNTELNGTTSSSENKRSFSVDVAPVVKPYSKCTVHFISKKCKVTVPYTIEDCTYTFKDKKGNLLLDKWIGKIEGEYEGISHTDCHVEIRDETGKKIKNEVSKEIKK
ncbi:hypothetical protein [Anaerosporobacter sp.]|uniref:hypothetical protein n=1 Tax=Anaerosporobacter sp. TaxID=1872529 RepID=UPI00286EEEA4|nr:hypothetical protein [Anaerosporobacter sp.]